MVEILVVMLILSILAGIAVPTFFGQRSKAMDADAKLTVTTAERAMETYGASGSTTRYQGGTVAELIDIEATLTNGDFALSNVTDRTYTITATSQSGETFTLERLAGGGSARSCAPLGQGGCPEGGGW